MGKVRGIRIYPDPVLCLACAPVTEISSTIRDLAEDMICTMYDAPGRGLAAPQIGQPVRMFVMDADWKDGAARAPRVFINPTITDYGDQMRSGFEGCLSIPGVLAEITRPGTVSMEWTDLERQQQTGTFSGFAAACVQHETDHLNGVLWMDRASKEVLDGVRDALAAFEVSQ